MHLRDTKIAIGLFFIAIIQFGCGGSAPMDPIIQNPAADVRSVGESSARQDEQKARDAQASQSTAQQDALNNFYNAAGAAGGGPALNNFQPDRTKYPALTKSNALSDTLPAIAMSLGALAFSGALNQPASSAGRSSSSAAPKTATPIVKSSNSATNTTSKSSSETNSALTASQRCQPNGTGQQLEQNMEEIFRKAFL